jgi:hypothetical protein
MVSRQGSRISSERLLLLIFRSRAFFNARMLLYHHEGLDRIAKAGQQFFMQNCAESTAFESAKALSGLEQETELLSG